ncbi:MAG: toll/interleukin-1 receptor domain-containing protein, partial [Halobacteriota archaeon]
MNKVYDAFISYARPDREFARFLARRLSDVGFSVFYDEADLAVGDSFARTLVDVVRSATATLVVMTPEYFASDWARSELEISAAKELEKGGERGGQLIPLLRRDCEIPPLLKSRLYVDCRTEADFENALPRIVDSLRSLVAPSSVTGSGAIAQGHGAIAVGAGGVIIGGSNAGSINVGEFVRPPAASELKTQLKELRRRVDAFGSAGLSTQTSRSESPKRPKLCFVAMPFGSAELNDIYEYFVKPSIEEACGLTCERGDDVFGSNAIMEDIRQAIGRARIVLADLTGRNPNVFYEVGIAHTLDIDVLLLSQSMEDVPFDLRHRRVLVYENTPKGCR